MILEEINSRFRLQAELYIKPLQKWKERCRKRGIFILFLTLTNTASILGSGVYYHILQREYTLSYTQTLKIDQLILFSDTGTAHSAEKENLLDTKGKFMSEGDRELVFHESVKIHSDEAELGLEIPESLSGKWKISFYIKEMLVYESDYLYPGTTISKVLIDPGELRDGSYGGQIEIVHINGSGESESSQRKVTVDVNNGSGPYIVEGGRG